MPTMPAMANIMTTWVASSGRVWRMNLTNASSTIRLTFFEIWENSSHMCHDPHVKVARLDQESERAQWSSLAKQSVVRMTIINAVTKRPCSIWFHSSWHSAGHTWQIFQNPQNSKTVIALEPSHNGLCFFWVARLHVWCLFCMEEKRCYQNEADKSHPWHKLRPKSMKVLSCHVDLGPEELCRWMSSDWNGSADYLQQHPTHQSLRLTRGHGTMHATWLAPGFLFPGCFFFPEWRFCSWGGCCS